MRLEPFEAGPNASDELRLGSSVDGGLIFLEGTEMKKQVLLAAGVSALLAGAPFAYAQAQSPSSDPTSASPGKTVTGCVTAGADGKSFTLTEAPSTGASADSAAASAASKT